MAEGV